MQAGDEIVKLAAGPEQMTVAEVDALLYLPGHPRQQLLRALRIPALSPGLAGLVPGPARGRQPGSGNAGLRRRQARRRPGRGFRPLSVAAHRARERLRDLDPARGSRRRAAAGGATRPVPHAAPPARRGATLGASQLLPLRAARTPATTGSPSSASRTATASGYLHTRRRGRRPARDRARRAALHPRPRADAPVLLISAGIGATPVLAMLHALAAEHSEREIWWLHGARNGRDHSFAAEARGLLDPLPNVAHPHLLQPPGRERSPGPRLRPARAGSRRRSLAELGRRRTPRRTSAGRRRSWRTSAPAWSRSAWTAHTSTPSRSGPHPA